MALSDLLNRGDDCGKPDQCFAENGTISNNPKSPLTEPTCDEFDRGFACDSKNLLGKLNWWFNRLSCAIKGIDNRISQLESAEQLIDIQVTGPDGNGNYTITEIYKNQAPQVSTITDTADTDTALANPVTNDFDGDGKPNVTWDVIKVLDGSVIGSYTYEIDVVQPPTLCQLPVATQSVVDSASAVSFAICVDGVDMRYLSSKSCVDVMLRDNSATVPGNTYGRTDFNFVDINPQQVQSTSGPVDLTVTLSNNSQEVFSISANRFKSGQTSSSTSTATLTFSFSEPVCDLQLDIYDLDVPVETLTGWSKSPDSIIPAYGNLVDSIVTFTNINSNILTVNYQGTAVAFTCFIQSLKTCDQTAACFAAKRCTDTPGNTWYETAGGAVLTGSYTEC